MRQTPTCYTLDLTCISFYYDCEYIIQVNTTKYSRLFKNATLGYKTFDLQNFLSKSASFLEGD